MVRRPGEKDNSRIEFRTEINNKGGETFIAALSTKELSDGRPRRRAPFRRAADEREQDQAERRGDATRDVTGADLCADPSANNVNYHITAFPVGAVRGQLHH